MQEDNIAIRLKFLINELGINSSIFADNCGISRATLSQLLTGRNKKISDILIGQIHKAYPNLSILWLLFNEGSMWIGSPDSSTNTDSASGENTVSDQQETSIPSDPSGAANTSNHEGSRNISSVSRKNLSENLNFPGNLPTNDIYSKEGGLNIGQNSIDNTVSQQVNNLATNAALVNEIENLRSKIKKVVQITIYFDDSTFETFYPK